MTLSSLFLNLFILDPASAVLHISRQFTDQEPTDSAPLPRISFSREDHEAVTRATNPHPPVIHSIVKSARKCGKPKKNIIRTVGRFKPHGRDFLDTPECKRGLSRRVVNEAPTTIRGTARAAPSVKRSILDFP